VEEYYSIEFDENGIVSTEDGWPSEGYIEFAKSKRLIVGWGMVDPQMAGYNFTGDSGAIFPSGYLQDLQLEVKASSTGALTIGCFLSNTINNLTQINSSWAYDARLPGFNYPTSKSTGMQSEFVSPIDSDVRFSNTPQVLKRWKLTTLNSVPFGF
jgi:hypothetical protein